MGKGLIILRKLVIAVSVPRLPDFEFASPSANIVGSTESRPTSQTIFLSGDFSNGGVQFAGFTDAGKFISSVTITATVDATNDIIGVDDVRFVLANGQADVPETGSTMVLLGARLGHSCGFAELAASDAGQ